MMDCRNVDAKGYFVFGMRFYFGLWLLYAGLLKWLSIGPNNIVGYITSEFDKTWSPHALNVFLGWVILVAEVVLPVWILSGRRARLAWSLTSLFMFMLTIGQTILMKPTVGDNWFYVVLTLACAALAEDRNKAAVAA